MVPRLVPEISSKCAFCDEAVGAAAAAVGIGDSRSLMLGINKCLARLWDVKLFTCFADIGREVTEWFWGVVAVIITGAFYRWWRRHVGVWPSAFLIVGKCYPLRHDDVVTLAFSRKITSTLLLPDTVLHVGDQVTDTKACAEQIASCLCVGRARVICARSLHWALGFVDHPTREVVVTIPAPLCWAAWARTARTNLCNVTKVLWIVARVNVTFVVGVPHGLAAPVAAANVIQHGFLPRSIQVAVLILRVALVIPKPGTSIKWGKEITLEDAFLQGVHMEIVTSVRFLAFFVGAIRAWTISVVWIALRHHRLYAGDKQGKDSDPANVCVFACHRRNVSLFLPL